MEIVGSTPEAMRRSPELIFDATLPLHTDVIDALQELWLEHAPEILDYDEPIPIDQFTDHRPVDRALAAWLDE